MKGSFGYKNREIKYKFRIGQYVNSPNYGYAVVWFRYKSIFMNNEVFINKGRWYYDLLNEYEEMNEKDLKELIENKIRLSIDKIELARKWRY